MKKEPIRVYAGENEALDCSVVILVPEIAISEAGHIKAYSCNSGAQTKHEFYAVAQMALIQFQDEELDATTVNGPIRLKWMDEACETSSGMAICRTLSGELEVLAHTNQPWRKLLEAAHRFCTRWIRLDI
jgi:hypothetical protein